MDERHSEFAFADGNRTFTCRVEASHRAPSETWWWFQVSTESHQRHAPFRAEVTDTKRDVQARVVAYYDNLLRGVAPASALRQAQIWLRDATREPFGQADGRRRSFAEASVRHL